MRYCVLCGIPITRSLHEPWLTEFRAVWIEDSNWDDVRLSGVGICDEYDDVITGTVPVDSRRRYDDHIDPNPMIDVALMIFDLESVVYPETSHYEEERVWGWGFHSSCWDLFTADFNPNLGILFTACLSMPIGRDSIMDWGHDYGGAAALDYMAEIPIRRSRFTDWVSIPKDMTSDPFNIPNLTRAIRFAFRLQNDSFLPRLSFNQSRFEADTFSFLSPELLQAIANTLPSRDVHSLRLASPVFATLGLPEKFWASRFAQGNEFDDIYEALREPPESWRALYLSLQIWSPGNPNLDNRKRVWKLAKLFQAALHQMEGVPCDGSPLKTWFEPLAQDGPREDKYWRTADRIISGIGKRFDKGCRNLRARALYFLQPLQIQYMAVSFIDTPGGRFVSGLQFVDTEGQSHAIGYLHHNNSVSIHVSSAARIQGWELALDMSGVRAIAIIAEDGTKSTWAGAQEASLDGVWPRLKEFGQSRQSSMSALKLISLGRKVSAEALEKRQWRNSCLWYPDVPPEELLFNGSQGDEPPDDGFPLPIKTLFFTGSDGRHQSNLVEVVVWTLDLCHIAGIELFYTDSANNQALGQRGPFGDDYPAPGWFDKSEGRRISMSIDGSGGEELKGFEVQEKRGCLVGLKILTNFGRELASPQSASMINKDWITVEPAGPKIVGLFCLHGHILYDLGFISTTLDSESELG